MNNKILAIFCVLMVLMPSFFLNAQQSKPLDAFVARTLQTEKITTINSLWTIVESNNLDVSHSVNDATFFSINKDILMDIMENKTNLLQLEIPYNSRTIKLNLVKYDIFSSGFAVNLIENGIPEKFNYEPGLYYRGVIEGMEGSLAAFSFFNEEIYGVFSIPEIGNINLIPIKIDEDDSEYHYVQYNENDLIKEAPVCHFESLPNLSEHSNEGNNQPRATYENCKTVEVYVLTDYQTYANKLYNATSLANYTTAIFNGVTTLYRNEGVYMNLKHLDMNIAPDAYYNLSDNSTDYLQKFGEEIQNNIYDADVAHLISSSSEGLGGIAWLDVLCDDYRYWAGNHYGPYAFSNIHATATLRDFPVFSWNIQVMTHEIGHNIGSNHTQWCGWPGGAIDGCWNLEYGNRVSPCSMPVPQFPVNGGTIMSYCHLQRNVGINFSNGFGQMPGDKIREKVFAAACTDEYAPKIALSATNQTINANRECTDQAGMTYYWNDNNTGDESDDILVLKIKKDTFDIGNLDNNNFAVETGTIFNYKRGAGSLISLDPTLPVEQTNYAMNRYWKINPIQQPEEEVEIYFPFLQQDITDVKGSINSVVDHKEILMYSVDSTIDPNPENGLLGADVNNFYIYNYGNISGPNVWNYQEDGSTLFAVYKSKSLYGGGGFSTTDDVSSIIDKPEKLVFDLYPNPAKNEINILLLEKNINQAPFTIMDIQGKIVYQGAIEDGKYKVNISSLSAGVYTIQMVYKEANHTKNFIIK